MVQKGRCLHFIVSFACTDIEMQINNGMNSNYYSKTLPPTCRKNFGRLGKKTLHLYY